MKIITVDEDFKGLMPSLAPDEYNLLEESIKTEGCREPIILCHGIIIDGYTRYEICERNNIKYKKVSKTFNNKDEAKLWIIKNQLGRRNLTDYDRGRLALQLKPIISEKKKRGRPKKEKGTILSPLKTRAEIAKIADLSEGTIDKIDKIEKEASPEIKEAASSGKISINKAYKETRPIVTKEEMKGDTEPLSNLKHWWKKASATDRRRFFNYLRSYKQLKMSWLSHSFTDDTTAAG